MAKILLNLPLELKKEIRSRAGAQDISMTQFIIESLEAYFEHYDFMKDGD